MAAKCSGNSFTVPIHHWSSDYINNRCAFVDIITNAFCLTNRADRESFESADPLLEERKDRHCHKFLRWQRCCITKIAFEIVLKNVLDFLKADREAFVVCFRSTSSCGRLVFSLTHIKIVPSSFVTKQSFRPGRIKELSPPPPSSYCLLSLSVGTSVCRSHSYLEPLEVSPISLKW